MDRCLRKLQRWSVNEYLEDRASRVDGHDEVFQGDAHSVRAFDALDGTKHVLQQRACPSRWRGSNSEVPSEIFMPTETTYLTGSS